MGLEPMTIWSHKAPNYTYAVPHSTVPHQPAMPSHNLYWVSYPFPISPLFN